MVKESMNRDRATDLGIVRINSEAIMTIASMAAMEIKGVHKMGGGLGKTLYDILLNRSSTRGLKIRMKDSEVRLTVSIIVDYAVDIPRVADEVQNNVKHAVERMTGLALSEVDVVVEGVHNPALADKTKSNT